MLPNSATVRGSEVRKPVAWAASVMRDGQVPILNGYLYINCYYSYTIEYRTYFMCDCEVSVT